MTTLDTTAVWGRKIFFLYPSALVQNQIIGELAQAEFEVYYAKDHDKLRRMLEEFPDSIVFASISEGMKEAEWEIWIKSVMDDIGIDVGILTADDHTELWSKYLDEVKVTCGYTLLKPDASLVVKQLTEILTRINAKGRRKYVRVLTDNEEKITACFPVKGKYIRGSVRGISAVGFSCQFDEDPELPQNALFPGVQIRLQTQLINAEGVVFGSRMEDEAKVYVILLSQRTSHDVHAKIRRFIQGFLQAKMDAQLGLA